MIAFLALGQARTTRQGRGSAIAVAIFAVLAIRLAGFSASALFQRSAWAIVLVYGIPLGAFALATFLAFRRSRSNVPAPRLAARRHQVIQGTAQ
jgi:lipopolysaccharide export system permease protein